ncbi:hypothetical protein ACWEV4_35605, partial [Streptomyces sp. NPDC003860]
MALLIRSMAVVLAGTTVVAGRSTGRMMRGTVVAGSAVLAVLVLAGCVGGQGGGGTDGKDKAPDTADRPEAAVKLTVPPAYQPSQG